MSRYYSDNPVADVNRYVRDMVRREEQLPHCIWCGEAIYPDDDSDGRLCRWCIRDIEIGGELDDEVRVGA